MLQAEEPPGQLPALPCRDDPEDLVATPQQCLEPQATLVVLPGIIGRGAGEQFAEQPAVVLAKLLGPLAKRGNGVFAGPHFTADFAELVAIEVEDSKLVMSVRRCVFRTELSRVGKGFKIIHEGIITTLPEGTEFIFVKLLPGLSTVRPAFADRR